MYFAEVLNNMHVWPFSVLPRSQIEAYRQSGRAKLDVGEYGHFSELDWHSGKSADGFATQSGLRGEGQPMQRVLLAQCPL